jgi:hypothetical protein
MSDLAQLRIHPENDLQGRTQHCKTEGSQDFDVIGDFHRVFLAPVPNQVLIPDVSQETVTRPEKRISRIDFDVM